MVLRLGPSQRFEVPVVEVLVSQRRLQLWIIIANVGILVMTIIDMIFFGNFLAIQFGAGEVYGNSFPFWLLYVHILKISHLVFMMFAIGRSRISFGVASLQIALVITIVMAILDIVTLIVLIVEITKCTDAYCFREGGDGIGVPGVITIQFFILVFTVAGSLVIRLAASVAISFVKQRIRIRNTAALENIATNRNPRDPLRGVAGVRTVTAVAGEIGSENNNNFVGTKTEEGKWGLRFTESDSENDNVAEFMSLEDPRLSIDHLTVFNSKTKKGGNHIVMGVTKFLEEESENEQKYD